MIHRRPVAPAVLAVALAAVACAGPPVTLPGPATAPDAILWWKTYGGPARDVGGSIAAAAGGGWVVVGSTRSFGTVRDAIWLLRLDAAGDTLWTRTFGSPPDTRTGTVSVAPTGDGGWLIGGARWFGAERNYDLLLLRVDSLGRELWSRAYGGVGYDHFETIRRTRDGGYVMGGGTTLPGDDYDVPWVLRVDEHGDTLWTRTYPGPGFGHADAVLETRDGGYLVAGGWYDQPGRYPADMNAVRLNVTGETLWSWTYGGPERLAWPEMAEELPDGGFVLAGAICDPCSSRQPNFDTHFDVFVVRLDARGDTVWTRRLGGDRNDLGYFVTLTSRGTYMVGGSTSPHEGPADSPWLVELNPEGEVVWSRVLPSTFPRNGVAQVREVSPDVFLVTGPPWLYQSEGDQDVWVALLGRNP